MQVHGFGILPVGGWVGFVPLVVEDLFKGFFAFGFGQFGLGGEGAVDFVEGDLFYGFRGWGVFVGFG